MSLMATYTTMEEKNTAVRWIKKDTPDRKKKSVMLKEPFFNVFRAPHFIDDNNRQLMNSTSLEETWSTKNLGEQGVRILCCNMGI